MGARLRFESLLRSGGVGLATMALAGCSGLFFPVQRDAFQPPPTRNVAVANVAAANGAVGKPAEALPKGRAVYSDMIARHAREAGVPVPVATAVVQVESNYNPNTRGRHGEIGLMQIKYETARDLGYDGTVADLYDPDTNLRFGMKYLAAAQKAGGGQLCGMMFKYQAGLYATELKPANVEYCDRVRTAMGEG